MKVLKSPIRKNLGANLFGVSIQFANQIILVPLYLHFWNVGLYSDWIVLSAICSFFTMTDMGLGSVTANKFGMTFSQNKLSLCRILLTNNVILIAIIAIISLLGCGIFISAFEIVSILKLRAISHVSAGYILIALTLHVFIGMLSFVWDAVYRANSQYYKAVHILNISRLSEFLIILFSLVLRLPIELMVTIYLFPKIIVCIYKYFDSKKIFDYRFSFRFFDWGELKKIFLPSITFMTFPLGNAFVLQGLTLVVNQFFGPVAVVTFNTTRTMCNFVKTLLNTIQAAVWPEYTIAYAQKNIDRMRTLHRKVFSMTTLGAILISAFLMAFGKIIYEIWTHGSVVFDYILMLSFLIVLLLHSLYSSSSVTLMATNKHSKTGVAYVILAFFALLLAAAMAHFTHSLPLVELSLLFIYIPLSIYTIKQALEMTNDTISGLLFSFITPKLWRK